jgi:hypothetical protein
VEAVVVVLGDDAEFEVAALYDEVVEGHGAFGFVAVREEDDCFPGLAFSQKSQLNTPPDKIKPLE